MAFTEKGSAGREVAVPLRPSADLSRTAAASGKCSPTGSDGPSGVRVAKFEAAQEEVDSAYRRGVGAIFRWRLGFLRAPYRRFSVGPRCGVNRFIKRP